MCVSWRSGCAGDLPMVQMMPVLRAVVGSESMSSRHMCSRKVSAMAALSCCVWMKAEPMSWALVLGILGGESTGVDLQEGGREEREREKERKKERGREDEEGCEKG